METRLNHLLDLSRVVRYLKDREKKDGGFSYAPDLYPDIVDTYYAVRTLQLLNVDMNRKKMAKYLKNIDWAEIGYPRLVSMLLYLYRSVDLEIPLSFLDLLEEDRSRSRTLNAQYYTDEIRKLLNQPLKPLSSMDLFQFQQEENLQSLRKKVSVLLNHGVDFEKGEIIRWVRLCQNGDGGFGFHPGTKTSYMENIHCALEILSKLHGSPVRIDTCREYILGCQTISGGFGRAPISFPFIESTFHGVAGLFLLTEMERGGFNGS